MGRHPGHAFISYVREDAGDVDALQRALEAAGIPVWRDTADLWPGEDWRMKIRRAIADDALVFIACFSTRSISRKKSYQNEELLLAIEQLRIRQLDDPWLVPVRFSECEIPDIDIGAGRTLRSIQRSDLFGEHADDGITRLITLVFRLLERTADVSTPAMATSCGTLPNAGTHEAYAKPRCPLLSTSCLKCFKMVATRRIE